MRDRWMTYLVAVLLAGALIASAAFLKGTPVRPWVDSVIYMALGFQMAYVCGFGLRMN